DARRPGALARRTRRLSCQAQRTPRPYGRSPRTPRRCTTGARAHTWRRNGMQAPMPLAHMQINVDPVNLGFYQDLMATLGWRITYAGKEGVEAETDDGADLWFQAGAKDVTNDYDGPGVNHMAFGAASTTDVDAVA